MTFNLEQFRSTLRGSLLVDPIRHYTMTELLEMAGVVNVMSIEFQRMVFWVGDADRYSMSVNASMEFVKLNVLPGLRLNNKNLNMADECGVKHILIRHQINYIRAEKDYHSANTASELLGGLHSSDVGYDKLFTMYFISPWDLRKIISIESNSYELRQISKVTIDIEIAYDYEQKRILQVYANMLKNPQQAPINVTINVIHIGATMMMLKLKNSYGVVAPAIRIYTVRGGLDTVQKQMCDRISGTYKTNKYIPEVKCHRLFLPLTRCGFVNEQSCQALDLFKHLETIKINEYNDRRRVDIAQKKCAKMHSKRFPITFNKSYVTFFDNAMITLSDIRDLFNREVMSAQQFHEVHSDQMNDSILHNADIYNIEEQQATSDERTLIRMMNGV